MPVENINKDKLWGSGAAENHAKELLNKVDAVITQSNANQSQGESTTLTLAGLEYAGNIPDSIMDFDETTRVFTIEPTGDSFKYWSNHERYEVTGIEEVAIPDVEGLHIIYFHDGTLLATQIWSDEIITKYAIVTMVLWDADNKKRVRYTEERHSTQIPPRTHRNLHVGQGTVFEVGGDLSYNAAPSGSPADDTASKAYIAPATILDEDLEITSVNSATPSERFEQILGSNLTDDAAKIPVIYLDGSAGNWRKWDNDSDRFAFMHNGGNTAPYFNEFTGGAWQLTECSSRDFIVYYVCMDGDMNEPVFLVMGQQQYETLAEAEAASASQINWGAYVPAEIMILHKLVFEHRTTYVNATHRAVLRYVESYNIRGTTKVALIGGNQNHAALQNLTYETANHTGFMPSIYFGAVDPTADNDSVDTADIGRSFGQGDFWRNTVLDKLFFSDDDTPTAAVWREVTLP